MTTFSSFCIFLLIKYLNCKLPNSLSSSYEVSELCKCPSQAKIASTAQYARTLLDGDRNGGQFDNEGWKNKENTPRHIICPRLWMGRPWAQLTYTKCPHDNATKSVKRRDEHIEQGKEDNLTTPLMGG